MTRKVAADIIEGLNQALEHAKGNKKCNEIHIKNHKSVVRQNTKYSKLVQPKGQVSVNYAKQKEVKGTVFVPIDVVIKGHVTLELAEKLANVGVACLVDCDEQV